MNRSLFGVFLLFIFQVIYISLFSENFFNSFFCEVFYIDLFEINATIFGVKVFFEEFSSILFCIKIFQNITQCFCRN